VIKLCVENMATEIVLPATRPETEWILGRAVQKVSPRRTHALITGQLMLLLAPWCAGKGDLGPEWRFRVQPPGEVIRPLVPDLAYLSYERMRDLSDAEIEVPLLAPDVAFEVRSPDDRPGHLAHKIAVYLAAGSNAVVVVDPPRETIVAHDAGGERSYTRGDTFAHPALPGLTFSVADLFEAVHRPRR
jgi:Uma2 family endonuclease